MDCDIFISGAGIAGLITAATLAQEGWQVTLADPAPPPATQDGPGADLRSTAILGPAQQLLERTGLWPQLAHHATPLEKLRAVDTTGWPPVVRDERLFDAADLDMEGFGWNLPNWALRHVLAQEVSSRPGITAMWGRSLRDIVTRDREIAVQLDDGTWVRAALAIGADGKTSALRDALGIALDVTQYGQTALALTVTHPVPHNHVSTEIYNTGGAFTLVPVADIDASPASAVVWMNADAEAARLTALAQTDPEAFDAHMTTRSAGLFGALKRVSPLGSFPVTTQLARDLIAPRAVLIAEAAHGLPPIGAQGLNTSLNDVAALCAAIGAKSANTDPGSKENLTHYARARSRDLAIRARTVDLFNRVCRAANPRVQDLRLTGLRTTHDLGPLRRAVMRAGLGGR